MFFTNQASKEIAHAALIGKPGPHQGKVVLWRAGDPNSDGIWFWEPASPTSVTDARTPNTTYDHIFCAGQCWDGDGDMILGGGQINSWDCVSPEPNWSWMFDPAVLFVPFWAKMGDMLKDPSLLPSDPFGHYYPSLITLFNGVVLSAGAITSPRPSSCTNPFKRSNEFQWFDKPNSVWRGTTSTLAFPGLQPSSSPTIWGFHIYPLLHLLRSGHVFASVCHGAGHDNVASPNRNYSPSAWVPATTWPPTAAAWQWQTQSHANRLKNAAGETVNLLYPSAVLHPYTVLANGTVDPAHEDEVIVIGGYDAQGQNPPAPAEKLVWRIQKPAGGSGWLRPGDSGGLPAMTYERVYANAVLLPDLSVLVVGGAKKDFNPYQTAQGTPPEQPADPVYVPELLDLLAATPAWTTDEAHGSPRLYHAVALLLPDGRVAVFGGYKSTVNTNPQLQHTDLEIYKPRFLQEGITRPVITDAPNTIGYGIPISLAVSLAGSQNPADEIDFATLIRCDAVTHHYGWDQRCIRLEITNRSGSQLTLVALPAKGGTTRGDYLAPPGYYMLFAVRKPVGEVRAPSVARFVRVL